MTRWLVVLACASLTPPWAVSCKRQPPADASAAEKDRAAVESAMAKLIEAWDNVETVKASVLFDMHQGAGGPGRTRGKGHYLLKKSAGKVMIRYFTENNMIIRKDPSDREPIYTIEHVEWAGDGDFMHQRTLQHKRHVMTRDVYRPDDVLQIGGVDLMNAIRRESRVHLGESIELEGRSAIVIGTSDEKGEWLTEHAFDAETGIRLQWVGKNAAGEETLRLTLSNLMLNIEWADGEFSMPLRSDIEFTDKTSPPSRP